MAIPNTTTPATTVPLRLSQADESDPIARTMRILTDGPRPEDHLPIPPEVRAGVELDCAYARARFGQDLTPESVRRQLLQRLLPAHYEGQNIAYLPTDDGVVVLVVGLEQISRFLDEVPADLRKNVHFTAPDVWW